MGYLNSLQTAPCFTSYKPVFHICGPIWSPVLILSLGQRGKLLPVLLLLGSLPFALGHAEDDVIELRKRLEGANECRPANLSRLVTE